MLDMNFPPEADKLSQSGNQNIDSIQTHRHRENKQNVENGFMMDESTLKEFRKRRKLLDNVNAQNVDSRITAFIKYCKSVAEINAIIDDHFNRYPTYSLLEGTGEGKPPDAGTREEIVSIGLYLLNECGEGNTLYTLAKKHGIHRPGSDRTPEDNVNEAMVQYIYHTLDYLEERIEQAVKMPDETEDGIRLRAKFIDFLINQKNVPISAINNKVEKVKVNKQTVLNLLSITGVDGNKIAMIDFSTVFNQRGIANSNKRLRERLIEKNTDCPAFIVCQAKYDKEYPFDIYKVADTDEPEPVSYSEFLNYEEMLELSDSSNNVRRGMQSPFGDGQNKMVIAFMEFLENDKGYPEDSMKLEKRGMTQKYAVMDMALVIPETEKEVAIIEFGYKNDDETLKKTFVRIDKYRHDLNQPEIPAYIVLPSFENAPQRFEIHQLIDNSYESISTNDFPTYNHLLFTSPLSNTGRQLCGELVKLAKDKHGLSINYTCKDYISLQIKKNKRAAAQIHRVNDSDEKIALVLAGYQEVFPETQSEYNSFMVPGEISQLSGNTKEHPKEINWLNGNVDHERLRYQAGVYIIKPGSLVLEDIADEVGGLLDLARENAGGGGIKDLAAKFLKVLGKIATLRGDEASDVDDLGRDTLVDAFADTLIHTEFENGFTLALMGNWGEGKSSVMAILKRKLRERSRFSAVYKSIQSNGNVSVMWAVIMALRAERSKYDFALFNAWGYEQTDNIAAGMAQEVVRGLKDGSGRMVTRWLNTLNLAILFNIYENRWNLFKMALCVAASYLLYIWLEPQGIDFKDNNTIHELAATGIVGLSGLATLRYLLKTLINFIKHPLPVNLERYFKLPNYSKHLGLIPVLKKHIRTLCALKLNAIKIPFIRIGRDRKLLVFVDDLDRCKSNSIAETLDAIRLVMPIPNVIVMICIDHRIAFKAVEKHYKDLAEIEDGNKRSSTEVARDYLGKIIQLPVRLEPIEHGKLDKYVYGKLFGFDEKEWKKFKETVQTPEPRLINPSKDTGSKGGSSVPKPSIPEDDRDDSNAFQKAIGKAMQVLGKQFIKPNNVRNDEKRIVDTPEEGTEFYRLAGLFEFNNPRQLLRLHNSFRFLKALGRGGDINTLDMLKMLFWQEYLYSWPMKVRGRCMASLIGDKKIEKVPPEVRGVLEKVQDDFSKLIKNEPDKYTKLAEFVRIVVLPHNEEGVLDSQEAINEWIAEEDKKEKEKKELSSDKN